MILAADDASAAALSGVTPVWEILGPGLAFSIIFALGAARFRPVRRTRKLAYVLGTVSAVIAVLSLLFGFQGWAA